MLHSVKLSTGDIITSRFTAGSTWSTADRSNFARKFGSVSVDPATFRDLSLDDGNERPSYSRQNSHTSNDPRDLLRSSLDQRDSKAERSRSSKKEKKKQREQDAELEPFCIDLSYLTTFDSHRDTFKPVVAASLPVASTMPSNAKSRICLSNIGFLAASVGSNLMVVNMRVPEVLLFDNGSTKSKKHKGLHGDGTEITALDWSMSGLTEGKKFSQHSRELLIDLET